MYINNFYFKPLPVFLYVLILHFLLGAINYSFFSFDLDTFFFFEVLVLFVLGVFFGALFNNFIPVKNAISLDSALLLKVFSLSMRVSLICTVLAFFYNIIFVATAEAGFWGRFSRNPLLINLLQLGIPSLLIGFYCLLNAKIKKKSIVIFYLVCLAYFFFLAGLGYRTPVVILFLSMFFCFLYHRLFFLNKRIGFLSVLIIFIISIVLLYLLSYVAIKRVAVDYDYTGYYFQIDWGGVNPFFDSFMPLFATARADFYHWLKIFDDFKYYNDTFPGQLFLSDFATWLPGTQFGSRNWAGYLSGARLMPNDVPMSITLSLLGVLWVDFGLVGVFVAGFLISTIMIFLTKRMLRNDSFAMIFLVFFLANIIKSVHSGYLDFSFYFQILFLITFAFYIRLTFKA
jgi:oligosaccharide repeat unit polymerase